MRQHRTIPALRLKHRSGICVAKMLDNVGLRYPHRTSGTKAPRTLRPLPLLRFAASATGGAHLCSIQYYLRFWLSSCRTSLAVSALRIVRCCPKFSERSGTLSTVQFIMGNSQPPIFPSSFLQSLPNLSTTSQTEMTKNARSQYRVIGLRDCKEHYRGKCSII